jgi:myo-inositol 2-dehydrogenase/D-chiro-inositol 1-dehydrogenase
VADGAGVLEAKPLFFFLERYRDAYVAEMQAFVQAVTEGLPSPAGGRDGREPAVIGLAARRSVREGRPVRLHEVDPGRAPIAARPAAQWSETEAAS